VLNEVLTFHVEHIVFDDASLKPFFVNTLNVMFLGDALILIFFDA
jgi:hypothetical protein